MTILQQIQGNGITDLRISEGADVVFDNMNALFEALERNTTIESVHFEQEFLGDLRNDARSKLLKALGKVPTLKEVHLADGVLQVSDITDLIVKVKGLRTLTLKNMVLQGVSEHFDACETALYHHGSLKSFDIEECTPAVKGISFENLYKAGKKYSGNAGAINVVTPMGTSTKAA
jgi:Ran GTPase-activating protein (RanGAP) involved in mRNA processing and transport